MSPIYSAVRFTSQQCLVSFYPLFFLPHINDTYIYMYLCKCTFGYMSVSLMAQTVKNLPAKQETGVWPLSWEDPLEEALQPTPVQQFCLENPHGQRDSTVHGVTKWDKSECTHTCIYTCNERDLFIIVELFESKLGILDWQIFYCPYFKNNNS